MHRMSDGTAKLEDMLSRDKVHIITSKQNMQEVIKKTGEDLRVHGSNHGGD